MPVLNRLADQQPEIAAWRRDLHRHPEIGFETHRTAAFVSDKLRAFGCDEVATGIGRTGVVGVIRGRQTASGRVIGLRADMDALPMQEETGLEHASTIDGAMHACGHDGHTAMLLGAARHLAETRNFDGTAVVIFQPAEETLGGAKEMLADGLMERFGIAEVYGLHNAPGLPIGSFAIRPGPFLASSDGFTLTITGRGGHAAMPHECIDTTLVASEIVVALQSIVARSLDPLKSAVLTVTSFRTGSDTYNIIPEIVTLRGTIRALDPDVRDEIPSRIKQLAAGIAGAHDARASFDYHRSDPVTVNHPGQTEIAARIAGEISGAAHVDSDAPPVMGAEDFSFMLEARPGAFMFLGNGDSSKLHHPQYDFDDAAIPVGCSYWVRLVEGMMQVA